jgi:DNA (cytosine-5)-methyltransferase 1
MRCEWQVEIDPYARAVLAKHWPDVRRHEDVRTFPPKEGEWGVDVICGGFPCQDISSAGLKVGIAGERSGLWREFARIIGKLRPRYVVVENVSALLARGMGEVLGDLSTLGYDAEWHVIPASAVGAPHRRERVWIVAYANDEGESDVPVHDVARHGVQEPTGDDVSDTECWRKPLGRPPGRTRRVMQQAPRDGDWTFTTGPVLGGGTDGVPCRMDRLRCLGNAVVPQVVEFIGRAIVEAA